MELDDLKQTWKTEVDMTTHIANLSDIRAEANKLDNLTKWAWLREGGGALVMGIVSLIYTFFVMEDPSWTIRVSTLIWVAPLFYAVKRFYDSSQAESEDDWTVMSKVKRQIEKRRKDVKMLDTLLWWHLIPVYVAGVQFSYFMGVERNNFVTPHPELVNFWVGFLAFFAFLYWLNKRSVRVHYRPALEKLEAIKKQLENGQ